MQLCLSSTSCTPPAVRTPRESQQPVRGCRLQPGGSTKKQSLLEFHTPSVICGDDIRKMPSPHRLAQTVVTLKPGGPRIWLPAPSTCSKLICPHGEAELGYPFQDVCCDCSNVLWSAMFLCCSSKREGAACIYFLCCFQLLLPQTVEVGLVQAQQRTGPRQQAARLHAELLPPICLHQPYLLVDVQLLPSSHQLLEFSFSAPPRWCSPPASWLDGLLPCPLL